EAPPGDLFLLRPGRIMADRPRGAEKFRPRLASPRHRVHELALGSGRSSFGGCSRHHLLCPVPVRATGVDQPAADRSDRWPRRPGLLASTAVVSAVVWPRSMAHLADAPRGVSTRVGAGTFLLTMFLLMGSFLR